MPGKQLILEVFYPHFNLNPLWRSREAAMAENAM